MIGLLRLRRARRLCRRQARQLGHVRPEVPCANQSGPGGGDNCVPEPCLFRARPPPRPFGGRQEEVGAGDWPDAIQLNCPRRPDAIINPLLMLGTQREVPVIVTPSGGRGLAPEPATGCQAALATLNSFARAPGRVRLRTCRAFAASPAPRRPLSPSPVTGSPDPTRLAETGAGTWSGRGATRPAVGHVGEQCDKPK